MATVVTYNGITIYNCTTREFDQEVVYDASGTDLVEIRYKLGWEGWIHCQAAATNRHGIQDLAGPVNTGATYLQFDLVSQRLAEPRKSLSVSWQGNTVLQAGPVTAAAAAAGSVTANMDVANGPHPRGLSVLHVSPDAIKVRWSIEVSLSGCPSGQTGNPQRKRPYKIINNRWSISESMDSDFFSTRRISGTIRFPEGLTPKHAFRGAIVPGLEAGFRREGIEYEASANGLEASYSVIDRQVHYAAPWPATHMEVTHSYSSNDGLTWLDDVSVTLRGSPEADRRALLSRMLQIVDARTEGLRVVNEDDKQYLLENVVLTEHFGDANVVHCQITTRHMGESTRIILGNILENKLGKPLELPNSQPAYDRRISRAPAVHGYDPHGKERSPAFLFLLTCFYQDPCSEGKYIFGANQSAPADEKSRDKTSDNYPVQIEAVQLPQGDDKKYSDSHKQAAYTLATLNSHYKTNRLRVMLPKGSADSDGTTAEIADLAPGIAKRILTFEGERIGDWPRIPDMSDSYVDGSTTGSLLDYEVELIPPTLSVDGRKSLYRVKAVACYGLSKLPTSLNSIAVGVLPYTSFKPADTAFPMAQSQLKTIGP